MMAERTKYYVGAELITIGGVFGLAMASELLTIWELVWATVWLCVLGFSAVYLINLEYKRACSRERHERRVVKSTEYVRKCYERYAKENA